MRDHTKLKAFELADRLVLTVYRVTQSFPKEELHGLTAQMRSAAISVPSNIVEGCARNSQSDYVHFLDMAYGSARELQYQVSVAMRLGYVPDSEIVTRECEETSRVLNGLIRSLRRS